jgi:hypothetical protein
MRRRGLALVNLVEGSGELDPFGIDVALLAKIFREERLSIWSPPLDAQNVHCRPLVGTGSGEAVAGQGIEPIG